MTTSHTFILYPDKHHAKKNTLRASRGRVHNDPKTVAAQRAIHNAAKAAYGGPCLTGPVSCDITFVFDAGDSHHALSPHTDTPDLPNLAALVYDALEGVCYDDDKQVCASMTMKFWGAETKVIVTVGEYE